jgi:hypothetical protein
MKAVAHHEFDADALCLQEVADTHPDLPGGALRVVTTHLEYYSALQRAAQIETLRAICDNGWRHAVAPRSNDETDPPFAVPPAPTFGVHDRRYAEIFFGRLAWRASCGAIIVSA